jgi:hypothetical protein
MMNRIAFLLLFSVTFAGYAHSLDRTLIAEGDYTATKKDSSRTLAHWKLWQLSNGEYDVVESSAKNAHLTQTFRFDAEFLPIGYSLDISPLSQAEVNQRPDDAKIHHPMNVSCEYKVQELKCATEYDGHKSVASIAAKYPYVFFPGEFSAMDFTWFLTGVVHLLEQRNVQGNPVNTYVMEDSPTNFQLGEIVLKADEPIKLCFTGEETSTVMDKVQKMRRYEGWGPPELSVVRVTSQGMVGLVSGKSTSAVGFGITNFVEHEPWTLPFRPVLKATQRPDPRP